MRSIALKSVDNHSLFRSPPATSFGRRSFEQVAAQLQGVHFSRCWTHWWNVSTSKANHVPPGDEDQVDPLAQYTSPTICPTSSKPLAPEGYERAEIMAVSSPTKKKYQYLLPKRVSVFLSALQPRSRVLKMLILPLPCASASREGSKSGGQPLGPRAFNKARHMVLVIICALQ